VLEFASLIKGAFHVKNSPFADRASKRGVIYSEKQVEN
jgi:hypothetical protein